jgi:hypothetical protein
MDRYAGCTTYILNYHYLFGICQRPHSAYPLSPHTRPVNWKLIHQAALLIVSLKRMRRTKCNQNVSRPIHFDKGDRQLFAGFDQCGHWGSEGGFRARSRGIGAAIVRSENVSSRNQHKHRPNPSLEERICLVNCIIMID